MYSLHDPASAVFVLGHMRSGSTLFVHLLLTSSELISAGEQNAVYRTDDDLVRLELAARWSQRAPFRRVRYAVDQINHDRFLPDPEFLSNVRVRPVFLVREPVATIQSILDLTATYYEPWSVQRAVEYYAGRLRTLARCATTIRSPGAIAVTYEGLVRRTAPTLRRIENFLGLDQQLRADYDLQRFTGRRGDPSPTIRSGRILEMTAASGTTIPHDLLEQAADAHRDCMAAIDPFLDRCNPS